MTLKCGIVGLPNVGKSSLFNALTHSEIPSENYPFCTIEPNVGIVEVPDERLNVLSDLVKAQSVVPAVVEFVDIAGLVKGASEGEGLGNKFLSHIREVDAIVHVVRCFSDEDIVHVDGAVDPLRDVDTIETELMLCDLEFLDKLHARLSKLSKSADPDILEKKQAVSDALAFLNDGKMLLELKEQQLELLSEYALLTTKPVLYLLNVDESFYANGCTNPMTEEFKASGRSYLTICTKLEEDLNSLDQDECLLLLEEFGLSEPGMNRMVQYVYNMLGLMTFFTAGEKEVRAWTIKKNDTAVAAAGTIHTDFAKGFIRAETVSYADFVSCKGWSGARDSGTLHSNGKCYNVADGDVMNFLFNV